jgi:hypothetical protein
LLHQVRQKEIWRAFDFRDRNQKFDKKCDPTKFLEINLEVVEKHSMKKNGRSKSAKAVLRLDGGTGSKKEEDPSHPAKVEQILEKTDGVFKVDVNHLTNTVSIEYDPKKISLDEIKQSIERAR